MTPLIEKNFILSDFGEELTENTVFIFCNFRNARMSKSVWNNCIFVDCDFSQASFEHSQFWRCSFKSCEFMNTNFDRSIFTDCFAYLSTFENANLGDSDFGFVSTDLCNFNFLRIPNKNSPPANCREIVGEVIRQIGDAPEFMALAGLVKAQKNLCWESLIRTAKSFVSSQNFNIVIETLKKFHNFQHLIEKFQVEV